MIFNRSSDIVYREFQIDGKRGTLIFLDGLVNMELIDSDVLKPLVNYGKEQINHRKIDLTERLFLEQVITAAQISEGKTIQDVIDLFYRVIQ